MNKEFDVVIIGSGPCGIGCAEVLSSEEISYAVIESYIPGGKVNIAPRVDNYPHEKEIPGPDLAMKFANRLFALKTPFINKEVISLIHEENSFKTILKNGDEISSKVVVIATGTTEQKMGLEKEDKFLGKGISYCAICDGHFFRGKDVACLVKGDYALKEAIYLSNLAQKLYVITNENEFKGNKNLLQKLNEKENVTMITGSIPLEIIGEEKVEGLKLLNNDTKIENTLDLQGIFPFIGEIPNSKFINVDGVKNEKGFIPVNKEFMGGVSGLFAGGDVLPREVRQIYLAEHDGKTIAKNVIKYLRG